MRQFTVTNRANTVEFATITGLLSDAMKYARRTAWNRDEPVLIRWQEGDNLQTLTVEPENPRAAESPRVVITKDGPQALLQGFTPPPVRKGNDTEQLTMF